MLRPSWLDTFLNSTSPRQRRRNGRNAGRTNGRRGVAIEPLEARCLLAVVPVTYGDLGGWQFANFDNSTGTTVGAAGPVPLVRERSSVQS